MPKSQRGVFLVLTWGIIAGSLDLAIVGPSLPGMVKEFGLEPRMLSWTFTLYALFNLISLPLVTGLADRYGKTAIMRSGLILLSIAGIIAALAPTYWMVLSARALTGMAVSGIFPIAPSLVKEYFPEGKRGKVLGIIGASFGISLIAGPLISGFFLDWFGWRSLFVLVSGVGMIALLFAFIILKPELTNKSAEIPWKSLLLLIISISSLATLISGTGWNSDTWLRNLPLICLVAGVASLFLFFKIEKRAKKKLFPRQITHNRLARLILLLGIGSGIIQACYIFLPHFLVASFGLTESRASFLLLPLVIFFTIGNYGSGRLTDRFGPVIVLACGWIFLGIALVLIGWGPGLTYYYVATLFFGLGLATMESPTLRFVLINIPLDGYATRAQGLLSVFISLGQLSGSALLGTLASESIGGDYQHAYRWILIFLLLALFAVGRLHHNLKQQQESRGSSE